MTTKTPNYAANGQWQGIRPKKHMNSPVEYLSALKNNISPFILNLNITFVPEINNNF
ncbi:hypothetical protein [Xylanibacter rodentium]|uniref:hypothetical protein n=1 Tax=Xylanibacter rodentium TaxID=2736289 RepID=UPI00258533FD|nr:hypothetical protein [Xylanibacter rodentium]